MINVKDEDNEDDDNCINDFDDDDGGICDTR